MLGYPKFSYKTLVGSKMRSNSRLTRDEMASLAEYLCCLYHLVVVLESGMIGRMRDESVKNNMSVEQRHEVI
jgi:hypothetical protein